MTMVVCKRRLADGQRLQSRFLATKKFGVILLFCRGIWFYHILHTDMCYQFSILAKIEVESC